VILAGTGAARAGLFNQTFDMVLTPPTPTANRITLDIDIGIDSDSDTADYSGHITVATSFDMVNLAPDFDELTFVGGTVAATDMDFNFALGLLQLTATGVAGTPTTALPPGSVTTTAFNAADHQIQFNQGMLTATGLVSQATDLAVEPATAGGSGAGVFAVTGSSVAGTTATYDVVLIMPIDSQDTSTIDTLTVTTAFTGSLRATGSFSVEIPEPATGVALIGGALALLRRPAGRKT